MKNTLKMLKKGFRPVVVVILRWEAKLVLKKYKPKIIGVTGSVGKTSTKDAIYEVTKNYLSVSKSEKSYNSADIGVALTILGCQSAWYSILGWLDIFFHGLFLIVFKKDYPKWLVLEIGVEYPGEIAQIVKWVKFDHAVVTFLPDMPVHVEFFSSPAEVIKEKMLLAKAVPAQGKVLINADDKNVAAHLGGIKGEILTFGFNDLADYRAEAQGVLYDETGLPSGLTFKFEHNGKSLPVRVGGVVGEHQIYPVLAALALGDILGVNVIEMIEVLKDYKPAAGRLRVLPGLKNSVVLDDTYNSSPAAVAAGLKTLSLLQVKGRRIAVLGDMLQLGTYAPEAHREIGYLAAEVCDLVYTVGLRSKFIDEVFIEKGLGEKVRHFDDSLSAGQTLQNEIEAGDVILVKGSQSMRMEKTVVEIMAEPDKKEKLLVRQEAEWL
ncbi:MAG TPA: UDP-N-acetylmuramoyl-tripeptide--D-alanyl-D-alanine ligase [Candidatus Paceibacterota bacterium]|nr:UDP-N-acetylmuramoyl-tripeptide--D-alanyl-D-alanine ligase [Candidatus Paceibacterota bacterium]